MKDKLLRNMVNEEIALEGLDGITFQALWLRIQVATSNTAQLDDSYKEQVWDIVRNMKTMSFYILEEPRPDLILFDRFTQDMKQMPDDIYPHAPVDDTKKHVRGSCSTYRTRELVTKTARSMEYSEIVEQWGSRFVIVANQQQREQALLGRKGKLGNFTIVRYCLLERIGRSRFHGEITYGANSLLALGEDPKTLFYHRKALLRANLITKQVYHHKSDQHSHTGTLLHLKRFYVEQKPKYMKMTEMVVGFLKTKDLHRALYDEVKNLDNPNYMKKLFKTAEFQRFVMRDIVPYREIYPNASVKQWKLKGSDKEKQLRILQLVDPEMSVRENWPSKEEPEESAPAPNLDYSRMRYGQPYLSQACEAVRQYGGEGCSQSELGEYLGAPRLTARSMTRNLIRTNMIAAFMNDVGRQRVTRFCYRDYEVTGSMAKKFNAERQKTINLLLSSSDTDVMRPASPMADIIERETRSAPDLLYTADSAADDQNLSNAEPTDPAHEQGSLFSGLAEDTAQPAEPAPKKMKRIMQVDGCADSESDSDSNSDSNMDMGSSSSGSDDDMQQNWQEKENIPQKIVASNPMPYPINFPRMCLDSTCDSSSDEEPVELVAITPTPVCTEAASSFSASDQHSEPDQSSEVTFTQMASSSSGTEQQEGNNVKPYKGKNIPNKNLSKSSVIKKEVHTSSDLVSQLNTFDNLECASSQHTVPALKLLASKALKKKDPNINPDAINSGIEVQDEPAAVAVMGESTVLIAEASPLEETSVSVPQVHIAETCFTEQEMLEEVCEIAEIEPIPEVCQATLKIHTAVESMIDMSETTGILYATEHELTTESDVLEMGEAFTASVHVGEVTPEPILTPGSVTLDAETSPSSENPVESSVAETLGSSHLAQMQVSFASLRQAVRPVIRIEEPRILQTATRFTAAVGFARRMFTPPVITYDHIEHEHEYYPPVLNGRILNGHTNSTGVVHHHHSSNESDPDDEPIFFEVEAQIEHHDNLPPPGRNSPRISQHCDSTQCSSIESELSSDSEPLTKPNTPQPNEDTLDVNIDNLSITTPKQGSPDSDAASNSSLSDSAAAADPEQAGSHKKENSPKGKNPKSSNTNVATQEVAERNSILLDQVIGDVLTNYATEIYVATIKAELLKRLQSFNLTEAESREIISFIDIRLDHPDDSPVWTYAMNELGRLNEEVINKISSGASSMVSEGDGGTSTSSLSRPATSERRRFGRRGRGSRGGGSRGCASRVGVGRYCGRRCCMRRGHCRSKGKFGRRATIIDPAVIVVDSSSGNSSSSDCVVSEVILPSAAAPAVLVTAAPNLPVTESPEASIEVIPVVSTASVPVSVATPVVTSTVVSIAPSTVALSPVRAQLLSPQPMPQMLTPLFRPRTLPPQFKPQLVGPPIRLPLSAEGWESVIVLHSSEDDQEVIEIFETDKDNTESTQETQNKKRKNIDEQNVKRLCTEDSREASNITMDETDIMIIDDNSTMSETSHIIVSKTSNLAVTETNDVIICETEKSIIKVDNIAMNQTNNTMDETINIATSEIDNIINDTDNAVMSEDYNLPITETDTIAVRDITQDSTDTATTDEQATAMQQLESKE